MACDAKIVAARSVYQQISPYLKWGMPSETMFSILNLQGHRGMRRQKSTMFQIDKRLLREDPQPRHIAGGAPNSFRFADRSEQTPKLERDSKAPNNSGSGSTIADAH